MKTNRSFSTLSIIALASVILFVLGIPLRGQEAPQTGDVQVTGLPDDWSFHHLVFSNPGTEEQAIENGTHDRWLRVLNDPRYVIQQLKRRGPGQGSAADEEQRVRQVTSTAESAGAASEITRRRMREDWTMDLGSGGKVGAGQYPAKFSFSTSGASCTNDFVVFNTGLTGGSSQPTIIAYNNLYAGCTGTAPNVYWQCNTAYAPNSGTADASTITTSVVLTGPVGVTTPQIAFVENTSSQASLVLLKWASSSSLIQMDNAGTNNVTAANYSTCSAPCMTKIAFSNAATSTNSSPFYDYINDVLYVGDDSGVLHKFQHIYNNSASNPPAEITGGGASSGWPQTMSSGKILTSPVYDSEASGNVLVGSSAGTLIRIPSGGGSSNIVTSGSLGLSAGKGIVDSPLVDSSAQSTYVVTGEEDNSFCNGGHPCSAAVYQLATTFAASNKGTEQRLGDSNDNTAIIYEGAFDNIYFSSSNSSSPTGNLYVCGGSPGGNTPTLYQVPITSNVLGTVVMGPALATAATTCSPVTEFYNTSGAATDWIFLSVTASNRTASPISCPTGTGCLMSFDVTSASGFGTSKATHATALEANGASGTIIDNAASTPTGTSQVYFSTLGTQSCTGAGGVGSGSGGCATQASQAGLN
jgi:hypothetical protein